MCACFLYSYMSDTLKSRCLKVNCVGNDDIYVGVCPALLHWTVTLTAVLRSNPSVVSCGVGHKVSYWHKCLPQWVSNFSHKYYIYSSQATCLRFYSGSSFLKCRFQQYAKKKASYLPLALCNYSKPHYPKQPPWAASMTKLVSVCVCIASGKKLFILTAPRSGSVLGSGLVTVMDRFCSDGCFKFVCRTKRIRRSHTGEQYDLKNGKTDAAFVEDCLRIVSYNV